MKKTSWIIGLMFLVLSLLEWICSSSSRWLFVLPAPSAIIMTMVSQPSLFLMHTLATFKVMGGGIALACAVALPFAWMMTHSTQMSLILQPTFVLIKSVPLFTLAPILVIALGWSSLAVMIPTALMIFFPLTITLHKGLQAVPQSYLDYFILNKAKVSQIFFKLRLPWSLPYLFSGLRVAAGIAGAGAIAGEWVGSEQGLGVLMLESRYNCDLRTTFAALFCLSLLSLSLYGLMIVLEKLSSPPFRVRRMTSLAVLSIALGMTMGFSQTQESFPKAPSLRFALDWLPNPNHVPLYAGIEKGFFREMGIDLKLCKTKDAGAPIPLLTAGEIDLAVSYFPVTLKASAAGADLKILGNLIDRPLNCILFRKDSGINTLIDLNGKVIGHSSGSKGSPTLHFLLHSNYIFPKALHPVNFDIVSVLGSGRVDAVYGSYWNIEPFVLGELGIETQFFTVDALGMPSYQELIVVACSSLLEKYPGFIGKFRQALQKSIDFCKKNPDAAFEIYHRACPDKSAATLGWERKAWEVTYPLFAESQIMDKERAGRYAAWLFDHGLLPASVDVNVLF